MRASGEGATDRDPNVAHVNGGRVRKSPASCGRSDRLQRFTTFAAIHGYKNTCDNGRAASFALRDPISPGPPGSYESGGPTDNVLAIWKATAPALDILAPDIYMSEPAKVQRVLELYQRPDNPLFVPEISNAPESARYFFLALDQQAIGFAPFGIDFTGAVNFPLGASKLNEEALAPFAMNYRLVAPMIGPQTFTVLAGQDGVNAGAEVRDVYGTVTAVSTIGRTAPFQSASACTIMSRPGVIFRSK